MSTMTTVTIGRNVGDVPMHRDAWARFQADTQDALSQAAFSVGAAYVVPINKYTGVGEWEGVLEASHIVTSVTDKPVDLEWLTLRLRTLATQYGQDAIALSSGDSHLASA